jgi:AcrR family transcriptional regulator
MRKSKNQPGRPRSEHSRAAILEAAYSFLLEQSVAEISTVHIARQAGVSTATVYRWWSTKEELLLDAFLERAAKEVILGGEGSPLDRIRQWVQQMARFFRSQNGVAFPRIMSAVQDNPTLREALLNWMSPRSEEITGIVMDAVREGQLPERVNPIEFADMLIGPLFVRLFVHRGPVTEAFALSVFDQVVAGVHAIVPARKTKKAGSHSA